MTDKKTQSQTNVILRVAGELGSLKPGKASRRQFANWVQSFPKEVARKFSSAIEQITTLDTSELNHKLNSSIRDSRTLTEYIAQQLIDSEVPDSVKQRGAIFTPSWLARKVVNDTLLHWRRLHRGGKQPATIADLSCGCGAFLLPCQNLFPSNVKIIGADSDPVAISYVTLLSWAFGYNWEIRNEDSLLRGPATYDLFTSNWNQNGYSSFDILIGNPPYVRSATLDQNYSRQLRSYYHSISRGNYDLSVAFIEHAIKSLAPGGIAAYVLTNKFMTTNYGREICNMLAKETQILNIDDFGDQQMFPGYTTYTCITTFAKKAPSKRFSVTRYPQGIEIGRNPGKGEAATLPVERLKVHPWDFAAGAIHDILRMLRNPKHPLLTNIFRGIQQGIRTGANDIFIVKCSTNFKLEPEIFLPFVGGEQINICQVDTSSLRIIFPYRMDLSGQAVLLEESELRTKFPLCLNYLERHKQRLKDRSTEPSNTWHAFSRSQNLSFFAKPKVFVREMMPEASFGADLEGGTAFCSGYGLDASNLDRNTLKMWTAILCTPIMEFVLRQNGTQLHSGWFRLMKHHMLRTRLPYFSEKQKATAIRLAHRIWDNPTEKNNIQKLDHLISKAFGLEEKHRVIIHDFIDECHSRSLTTPKPSSPTCDKLSSSFSTQIGDSSIYEPVTLNKYNRIHVERFDLSHLVTFKPNKKKAIHNWYQYTQGFSSALVEFLLEELKIKKMDTIVDPFSGCGTTILVCRQRGLKSIGFDVSPLMVWVAKVKISRWNANEIETILKTFKRPNSNYLQNKTESISAFQDYLNKAYSSHILKQITSISGFLSELSIEEKAKDFFMLGMVGIMEQISQIRKHGSHYRFMLNNENVGLQKLNIPVVDPNTNIWPIYWKRLLDMLDDIRDFTFPPKIPSCNVYLRDARDTLLESASIDAVITSPPYLNRNNYISQQKAELAILGLVSTKDEYKKLVQKTFRSHTDSDLENCPHSNFSHVNKILKAIKLTKGNNPKIPHMIAGYFEDLSSTLRELYRILKPGGVCAFVVGNTRWGGVVAPVDHLLMMMAESWGFCPEKILITRLKGNSPQQMRQFGRIPVRESIVIFRKPR